VKITPYIYPTLQIPIVLATVLECYIVDCQIHLHVFVALLAAVCLEGNILHVFEHAPHITP
jgi:hypothetical protein